MNIQAIIYESNTGFTRRYAALFSRMTGLNCYSQQEAKRELAAGSCALYFGWICANRISGYQKAAKRYDVCAVVAVGAAPETPKTIAQLKEANNIAIPLFYLRGGVNVQALSGIKRRLLLMIAKSIRTAGTNTPEEQDMADVLQDGGDFVQEDNLAALKAWYVEQA